MTNKNSQQKRAVVFLRARTIPHDEALVRAHLDVQRQQCRQVAEELGVGIVREYAVTGGTTDPPTRHAVQTMLDQVAQDGIGYVIAASPDRLSRHAGGITWITEALRAAGAWLVTPAVHAAGAQPAQFRAHLTHLTACLTSNLVGATEGSAA